MKTVGILSLVVFLQMFCVGANVSTLEEFNTRLGGTAAMLGVLWFLFSGPRAILSPIWGSLSDRWGRRPLMIFGSLACLSGSLMWWQSHTWWMLAASRFVDSAFSAQAAIAAAIVADVTTEEKRARGMGMIGGMFSIAFTLGAPVGAIVADRVSFQALGLVMAALQAVALVLVFLALPETAAPDKTRDVELRIPLFTAECWRRAFRHPAAVWLLAVGFVLTCGYMSYNTTFPQATRTWFHWGPRDMANAFVILGIVSAITQGGLLRPLVPRLGEKKLLLVGIPIMAAGFTLMLLHPTTGHVYLATALIALGGGFAVPCLSGALSRLIAPEDQGMVMGLNQTAMTLGRAVGPLVAPFLFSIDVHLPFAVAVGVLMLAWALVFGVRTEKASQPVATPG